MKQRLLRLSAMLLIGGLGLLVAAVLWHNWGDLLLPASPRQAPTASPAWLERGAYMARAGNCMACHTARGGAPLAGGRAIDTPFGAVYSSNLTPDARTGLGTWSADDFWRALHHGRSRDGRLLAPAFPYEHTTLITREDSDAIYLWLRTQPPVQQATPPHTLRWPLGTQPALALWRTLFFEPGTFRPDPERSAEWNRGAYLVQGPGHCAACHSPRNPLGASGGVANLSGGLMPGVNWYAPALDRDRETGLRSTPLEEVVRLLQTGRNDQAGIGGPMAEVVQHSLQHLSLPDLRAMAVYLQSLTPDEGPPARPAPAAGASVAERGRRTYDRHCATCHGEQGQGVAGIYPAVRGNRAVLLDDPTNLVQSVLYGGYAPSTAGHPRPFGMPPFVLELTDRDIAEVLTHLRQGLQAPGHRASEVTALQVNRIRANSTP